MGAPEVTGSAAPTLPKSEGWVQALELPCQLTVEMSIPRFTVGDLLRIDAETVIDTGEAEGGRVPVRVNGQLIGWGEFDVVGEKLAIRLAELI